MGITLDLNMKTGLTQWLVFSPKLPSVHSTSMVLLELLRKKMDSACCQLISSMRKLSFSSGFGWFLSVCTGLFLIFRLSTFLGKQIRVGLITIHGGKSCRRSDVEAILDPADQSYTEKLGDWFLLHLICKNLNVLLVNDLIRQLHKSEEGSNSNTETLKLRPEMTSSV